MMKVYYCVGIFLLCLGCGFKDTKLELEKKKAELEQKEQELTQRMKREEDSLRRITSQDKSDTFVVEVNHPEQLENYLDAGSSCKAEGTWSPSLAYVIGGKDLMLAMRLKNGKEISISYPRGACANCANYVLDDNGNKVKEIIIYDYQKNPIRLKKKFNVFGKISSTGIIHASRVEQ